MRLFGPVVQALIEPADKGLPEETLAVSPIAAPLRTVFTSEKEQDGVIRRTLVLAQGETLTSRLVGSGITRTETAKAMEALRARMNPRKIPSGRKVVLLFRRGEGGLESFTGLELRKTPVKLVSVERLSEGKFKSRIKDIVLEKRRFAVRGVVRNGIYESGLKNGVPAGVLNTMIKTYSYMVDFQREVRKGDRFEVLYEQATDDEGKGVGAATLIYAALQVGGKIMPAYRVAVLKDSYEYFNAAGRSIRKSLLRTPLKAARLTSKFGMRRHPILGYSRMHKGVDFGAPIGTPIYAAGAGLVEYAGARSGYGRYIRLRHNKRVSTAYAHLSRFARGLTRGTRVKQGQVIGYVGKTGIATGPHLHYEVLIDKRQVNPLKVKVATNAALSGTQLAAFQDWRSKVHSTFEALIAEAQGAVKLAQNAPAAAFSR